MPSPRAAPRPWPTCSGPVGLAETNSTLTERPAPPVDAPYGVALARGCARDRRASWSAASQKLMKPGPAISVGLHHAGRQLGAPRGPLGDVARVGALRAGRAPWPDWWRGRRGRRPGAAPARTRRRARPARAATRASSARRASLTARPSSASTARRLVARLLARSPAWPASVACSRSAADVLRSRRALRGPLPSLP